MEDISGKHNGATRAIMIGTTIAVLAAIIFGAIYYAHRSNEGSAAGTASSSLPSNQTQPTTNTSPSTSPCPNDAPPMVLNIGGNTVEACNQAVGGTATTVSSTSITVKSSDTGNSQTFAIASSTQITHHGQPLTTSDIKVGDTVYIIPSNTDANEAWYLLINPTFQAA